MTTTADIIEESARTPFLTRAEEIRLVAEAQAGNRKATSRLVISQARYVAQMVRRYALRSNLLFEDAFASGLEGLLHAIRMFDPKKGSRLLTYAHHWIRAYLTRTALERHLIHVPERQQRDGVKFAMLSTDHDNDTGVPFVESLTTDGRTPEEALAFEDERRTGDAFVDRTMACLSRDEKTVIRARTLAPEGEAATFDVLGRTLGVTRQRAEQIHASALRKMRAKLTKAA